MRNIAVCMSVCLSVRSHISRTSRPNFTKISVHVTCGRCSVLLWRQCNMLCTSGFVDDVMYSHNGANRPQTKTTRMFRPFRQMAAPVGRQATLFGRVRRLAAPAAKSTVSECILSFMLHLSQQRSTVAVPNVSIRVNCTSRQIALWWFLAEGSECRERIIRRRSSLNNLEVRTTAERFVELQAMYRRNTYLRLEEIPTNKNWKSLDLYALQNFA